MSTQSQQQSIHSSGSDGTARSEFLRNKAIINAINEGMPVAEAARRHGVTRQWAHELKRRWEREGEAGLLPRSRRAHRIANRTDGRLVERLVAIRRELDSKGLDAGPESIAARLEREGLRPPANSTIHRILKDAGLVRPEPRKRPKSSYTRFEAALPNETWQSDFTHWPLADGTDALIVSWLDDHSRFLLYSHAFAAVTMKTIEDSFRRTCSAYGIPASTLTDNGSVYTTRLLSADPGPFERLLALMGVRQKNGKPYHPQTQGKIERWHRTLKQWLTARPLAKDIDALNTQLDEFRHEYNEERPHRALNRRTPREAYEAKGKAGPDPELAAREQARREREEREAAARPARNRPVPIAERKEPARVDVTVPARTHKVDQRGCVTQKGIAGGRRTINVGKENAGRTVELEVVHGIVTVTDTETGEILADQTLDTTRDYQYRKPIPGVNDAPGHM
ncbi:IS481 family transposase [Bifidobacterium avesanii]|uniref:IS481 family transposase n=1 Tax=Bifidobacterium avesanii TaxID=1798157 RepID=A0A7K3TKY8_9BIFI|nr:IS481 family transposase [Bifidobacterium avesanii]KAB8286592.1 integrase [Bifidobacterium avesanii]NEG79389.1 IS481 family transposase [Bifidobacterium avesanii]